MSGHSKWATIKRAKSANDARRSNVFTKLSKNIAVAAKAGADPDINFKLRIAIDKARVFNMPKDNIERAIKRGSGGGDDSRIESLLYEAYGPEGVAIIIEILTDNKNRAVSNLKHVLNKHGGNLGNSGSVLWMFEYKGEIILDKNEINNEDELKIIDSGAEDIVQDGQIKVITSIDDLEKVKDQLQTNGFKIESSEMIYWPKDKVAIKDEEKLLKLLDALDDDEDVNNIHTNANI